MYVTRIKLPQYIWPAKNGTQIYVGLYPVKDYLQHPRMDVMANGPDQEIMLHRACKKNNNEVVKTLLLYQPEKYQSKQMNLIVCNKRCSILLLV
jgi:hypothetical protein